MPDEFVGAAWVGCLFLLLVAFLAADLVTGFGWLLPVRPARQLAVAGAVFLAAFGLVQGLRAPVVEEHAVEVKVSLTFDNIEAVKRAVEVGSGVAILPRPTLEHEVQAGTLAAVPLSPQTFVRPLGMVCRRGRKRSPNTEAFIALLQHGGRESGAREGANTR